MNLYEYVEKWVLPADLLAASIADMAPDGQEGNEGIVLWAGTLDGGIAQIVQLIGLHGPLIQKRPLQMNISPDLFAKVSIFCGQRKLILLGQIHSHPETFTDLSYVDKKYGIATPNFFSVVAPHYAQRPETTWNDCGVHVFEERVGFRRLSQAEVKKRVLVDRSGKSLTERLS